MATSPAGKQPAPKKTATSKKPTAPKKAVGIAAPKAKAATKRKTPVKAKAKPARKAIPVVDPDAERQKTFDVICEQLAAGRSLRSICRDAGMPAIGTVMRWLGEEKNSNLREQYACAREAQADTLAEEILEIADEDCAKVKADPFGLPGDAEGNVDVVFDATAVARNRLRVDARKWLASKMAPKKYGDKLMAEHSGPGGTPITVQSTVTFVQPPVRPPEDEDEDA